MHEMAIAQGVLDIVLNTAASHDACKVTGVKILLGELSGVVPESLEFGFEALSQGTIAAGALLSICVVPFTGFCRDCGQTCRVEKHRFVCPVCSSYAIEIMSGQELKVESVEVE